MAGYQSLFSGRASANTATEKTGKQGYTSVFGTATIQQATDDEIKQQRQQQAKDAAAKQKSDADAAAKAAQDRANNSIFGKVKTAVKSMATDIVHTGEKSANTVAAGVGGTVGATVAAAQMATGHKQAAQKTVDYTNKGVDAILDHGAGNQGGYINSKDAATSNPKAVIKGIAKGTADIAPLVIPAGKAVEGGSILARAATKLDPALETALRSEKLVPGAARAAVGNAAVGAGTDATNQVIDTGHVNLKQTGQAALQGGVFGAAMHGVEHGGASLFSKVRQNTLPEHVAQAHIDATAAAAPDATPGLPQPGAVIAPQPALARAEIGQEKPAIVPSNPSVPLAHNGAIRAQPTLPFDRPVEGQLPIDAAATAKAGEPVPAEPVAKEATPPVSDTPKPAAEVAPKAEAKPEPIDGYAHSDHLRKDFADTMRDMDSGKGGNKYHVHDSGMPDTGEKSPFYRQFFKENGKAPTKADYNAEAHKLLSTGKAGDDHATEVYKQLLEREGKTAPEPKVEAPRTEPKPKAEPVVETKPVEEAPKPIAHDNADIPTKEMQDIIDTHRKRFGDENVKFHGTDSTDLGHYNYHSDMIHIAKDDSSKIDTYNHESIHKAIGQFLSDKEIKQLYTSVVKARGGKLALATHYKQGGYDFNWRKAAEEEIANGFNKFLKDGHTTPSRNWAHKAAWQAYKMKLPSSVEEIFYKLAARINETFGKNTAAGHLDAFYKKVHDGDFKDAPRRTEKHTLNKSPLTNAVDKTIDHTLDSLSPAKASVKSDSPALKPEAKAEPTPVKAPTPPAEKPAGEGTDKGISRTAASVQQKALEKGLEKDYGQLAEYDKTTIKKQAEQATELLNGPRDDIEAILAGEKPLPDGLKASTFIKAIEEHPEYSHDPDMLRDLGRSDIHKQISTAAQELRLSRERNPNSSVEAIRQIDQIRKAAFKEKYGKTAEKAQSEEVKAIQQAQPKLDTSDWDSFIDTIKC